MEGTVHFSVLPVGKKNTDNYVIEKATVNALVMTLALPRPQQHHNAIHNMQDNTKFKYQLPVSKNRIIRVVTLGIVSRLKLLLG